VRPERQRARGGDNHKTQPTFDFSIYLFIHRQWWRGYSCAIVLAAADWSRSFSCLLSILPHRLQTSTTSLWAGRRLFRYPTNNSHREVNCHRNSPFINTCRHHSRQPVRLAILTGQLLRMPSCIPWPRRLTTSQLLSIRTYPKSLPPPLQSTNAKRQR